MIREDVGPSSSDEESMSEMDEEELVIQGGDRAPLTTSGAALGTLQHASNLFNAQLATAAALGASKSDPMDLLPALGSENVPPPARELVPGSRSSRAVVPKLGPNPSWDQYVDVWLEDKSSETCRKYDRAVRTLRAFVNDIPPESVTLQQLRQYRTYAMENFTERSRRDYIVAVRSFYVFLFDQQIITRNHGKAIKVPPKPVASGQERALTRLEVQQILDNAKGMSKHMFATMYYAGLRINELRQLSRTRVTELGNGKLKLSVDGKGCKARDICMGTTGSDILRGWLGMGGVEELLFPIAASSIRRRLKTVLKRAKLPSHISPHWLRHAFATHAYEAGVQLVALSKVLGHSSVKTTLAYIHSDPQSVGDALD